MHFEFQEDLLLFHVHDYAILNNDNLFRCSFKNIEFKCYEEINFLQMKIFKINYTIQNIYHSFVLLNFFLIVLKITDIHNSSVCLFVQIKNSTLA